MRLLLLITIIYSFSSCSKKRTELGLNLEIGKSYRQSMTSDMKLTQTINGVKVPIGIKSDGLMSYTVKSKEGDNYNLEVVYKSLELTMDMADGKLEFSSEKRDDKDFVSAMLAQMKNKPFFIKMSKAGKLIEVTNMDNLVANIFDNFPKIPEEQKQDLKAKFLQSYGPETLKGNFDMTMAIFPSQPVVPGETWVVHSFLESPMKANIRTTYSYVGTDSGYHTINGDATLESADQAYTNVDGTPTKYDVKGTVRSSIKVDHKTGWIVSANVTQLIAGDTYVKTYAYPQGFRVPLELKNIMLIRNN